MSESLDKRIFGVEAAMLALEEMFWEGDCHTNGRQQLRLYILREKLNGFIAGVAYHAYPVAYRAWHEENQRRAEDAEQA